MKINLNDKVKVKLTESGKKIARRYYEIEVMILHKSAKKYLSVDKEINKTEWQLWY